MLTIKMILCEINKNANKDEILYKYFFDSFKNNYIKFFSSNQDNGIWYFK